MKKTITILVLLCMTATILPGETLPDAPSALMISSAFAGFPIASVRAHRQPVPVQSYAERNNAKLVLIGLGVGALIGLIVALSTRNVHCPRVMYEGHLYDGTSPGCPTGEGPLIARKR
jgi:hypothetical protein